MSSKKNNEGDITSNGSDSSSVVYQAPFPITGPEVQHGGRTYRLVTKKDFFTFREFADSLDGFEMQYNRQNEFISWNKKVAGEPMRIIKVFGVLPNVLPATLYDMLQDATFRALWDTHRIDAFRIVKLDENNDIGYYAAKSPVPGVSNRDFVNQRAWINSGNNEYAIFNTSVPHRDVPIDYLKVNKVSSDSVVRGISKITGYLIRPWVDNKGALGSCITYVTQCDPGGWIPAPLINYISTKVAPSTLKTVAQAAAQFLEWLPKQENYVKDWPETADPFDTPVKNETIAFAKKKWSANGHLDKKHASDERLVQ
ncbi:hypothetical protein C3747_172g21 [Trypanosoma cruzi]|uniref:START domain-containing protein n=2 Tax=Trypanosoma cruzi TaxID=5693 RepID=Q4E3N4_TRYCC|nr:hypothetical protein, conserved [Trypanosoma cruzi]EAN99385.1 hypothetical protein, conserved [Trypanosoma cruzi]KAF5224045.1 hypothetical protein ECC02_002940 [Trypanosoma cruzi]KAF8302714.1 putative START domain containing protein [Trypanosoma cruzi]PWV03675.1 hypothetical protein C3747_172g21 [Trypanosoma cruzi]RNC60592.1 hypothetical protein TcCL_ESM01760 [Trypanosoma cruzi]|eukprot:XP_821236.1 hypothetical protein [Trypanosoma cruzi strain CL Brener]